MGKKAKYNKIDLMKLFTYTIKRMWIVVLCAEIGFGASYLYTTRALPETYTASGTMYVNNGNPNLSEYQYTNSGDLSSAVQLIKTYMIVVKSDKVMSSILDHLISDYPDVTADYVSSTLSMASVSETGVVRVSSKANNAKLAKDIVNIVMDVAPDEIIRVVGAGKIEIIDYATVPIFPDAKNAINKGLVGALIGITFALGLILLLCLLDQKVVDANSLENNYALSNLASIRRQDIDGANPSSFLLTNNSQMDIVENYAKLRMNLFYTLINKESKTVVITSSISGEGKSTIASNLAISCSMGGKKVLLIDSDMRRASLNDIFEFDKNSRGLSDILVGNCDFESAIHRKIHENLDVLPAGHFPPNPAELLGSNQMIQLLKKLELAYDLVLLDMPPINIVSDPLALSTNVAGCLFVVRQNYSDYRDINKSLTSAQMTGLNVLGFVFYGERINQGSYYSHRYYKEYYKYNGYEARKESDIPVQQAMKE